MRNRLPIALGLLLIEGVYMKYIHGAVGATNVLSTRQAFSVRKKNHRKKMEERPFEAEWWKGWNEMTASHLIFCCHEPFFIGCARLRHLELCA